MAQIGDNAQAANKHKLDGHSQRASPHRLKIRRGKSGEMMDWQMRPLTEATREREVYRLVSRPQAVKQYM